MIKDIKNLLFENIRIRQTIFKNTFWLAFAEGISKIFTLILVIYMVRILGATEFGKFTFALSFVSMFAVLSNFGLSDITTRELSRDKKSEKEYSSILSLKILLSIGALILMLIGSFFISPDIVIRKIIWILAFFVLISNFFVVIYAFFRARQKMEYEALAKISQALIMVGVIFFVLFKFPSVENLSYGYLFVNLVFLILILLFFHFRIYRLSLSWNKATWKKFLKSSWPLGSAAIFSAIFINIDSVMMGYLGQITQTGWYNVARRTVSFTIVPAALIFTSFFPVLSKLFKESKEMLQKVWNFYMELMIILAIPLVIGGIALASKIINFFYNQSFSPSIFAFQILIIMAGITFLYEPFYSILIVSNQQKKIFWITLTGAIINISLNLILIPLYSLYGAAVATIITYIILLFLMIEFSRRFTSISVFNLRLLKILIIAFLSSSIMFIAISQSLIYNLNVILTAIIGILIYFTTLFLFYKFLWRKKKQKPFLFRE